MTEPDFNLDALQRLVMLQTDCATLLAVHGFLALALRHPEAGEGESAELVAGFAQQALRTCIDAGVFGQAALDHMLSELRKQDSRTIPEELR